jgi:hypothetical protein
MPLYLTSNVLSHYVKFGWAIVILKEGLKILEFFLHKGEKRHDEQNAKFKRRENASKSRRIGLFLGI